MRKNEVEERALKAIERAKKGQPVEDDRIELKADWPTDPFKAARRVAAHANVAHGEEVLWLIGVDEAKASVPGTTVADPAQWWPKVQACFEQHLAPRLATHLNIETAGVTVIALVFETDRLPFVVKNEQFGRSQGVFIEYEVPWRDGTKTRTARHADLVSMLLPTSRLPEVEVRGGRLSAIAKTKRGQMDPCKWQLELHLYLVPTTAERVVIPFHRCAAATKIADNPSIPFTSFAFQLLRHSLTIRTTDSEVIVEGPGFVTIKAECHGPSGCANFESDAFVELTFRPTGSDLSVPVTASMPRRRAQNTQENRSCCSIVDQGRGKSDRGMESDTQAGIHCQRPVHRSAFYDLP